jgi:hypothetical protein
MCRRQAELLPPGSCDDEVVMALPNRGVQAALVAAVLFGAGTPIAKMLLGDVSPWLLAGSLLRIGTRSWADPDCPPFTARSDARCW